MQLFTKSCDFGDFSKKSQFKAEEEAHNVGWLEVPENQNYSLFLHQIK
jgi:hypothetical protein